MRKRENTRRSKKERAPLYRGREKGTERRKKTASKDPLCALVCNYSRACTENVMTPSTDPVGATTQQTQPMIQFEPAMQLASDIHCMVEYENLSKYRRDFAVF